MHDSYRVQVCADLEALMPEYLARRRQDAATLRASLENGDFNSMQRIGHRIKGSGAAYELNTISEIGGLLERHAPSGDHAVLDGQIRRLEQFLDNIEVCFA